MPRPLIWLSTHAWPSIREFFTLREQELRARRISAFERIEIRNEIERAAVVMAEAEKSSVASVRSTLAREALTKVIVATAAAHRFTHGSSCEEYADEWPSLDEAISQLSALSGSQEHRSAMTLLTGSEALADDEYRKLANLFAHVERLTDLRSGRDFRITRWLRALGVFALLVVGSWLLIKPSNLARGRIVTSSSICGEMPAADLGQPQLSRVVDGVRIENSFAICTNTEVRPWVTVDLGAPHSIQEIVVYPRSDGPWGKGDLPEQIAVSLDNQQFEVIAARAELYTTDFPWRVELPKRKAQYVQLMGVARSRLKLVLNEIEVYGR